jgi:hypothetical protein
VGPADPTMVPLGLLWAPPSVRFQKVPLPSPRIASTRSLSRFDPRAHGGHSDLYIEPYTPSLELS